MASQDRKPVLWLTLLGLVASVAWVGSVQGGGPEGGDITPGPPDPLTGPGRRAPGVDSAGLVRLLSSQPFTVLDGKLREAALVAGSHTGADLAAGGAPSADDSLECHVKGDTLKIWPGLGQLRLHGRFSVTDWDETDGESVSLAADTGVRGLLLVWVGQRVRSSGDVVGSFGTVQNLVVIPVKNASVDLTALRAALQPLVGQGLDAGVSVISRRKGPSGRQMAHAAFAIDDEVASYDVETP